MQLLVRALLLVTIIWSLITPAEVAAARPAPNRQPPRAPSQGTCEQGTLPHGALWLVCIPSGGWNRELVVWAHGYVGFDEPINFYHLQLDDVFLPDLVQQLGFAFAATSYRRNGLVILDGAEDVRELVELFRERHGTPRQTYMVGASEGGIITTLLIERSPHLFSGGLALCGPIGSFKAQLDYFGDFRVLFDYFFPGVLPGDPRRIPPELIQNWDSVYEPRVRQVLDENPGRALELIRASGAAIDQARTQETIKQTASGLLWYNVFGMNDARELLGGNPYDNRLRWYSGSTNDLDLNVRVRRVRADGVALRNLVPYETSGQVTRPLVTLHTTGDPIIPFWHEILYFFKGAHEDRRLRLQLPVLRYGHCEFTVGDALTGFALLYLQVNSRNLPGVAQSISAKDARREFDRAKRKLQDSSPRD